MLANATARTRQAIIAAQAYAREHSHPYVGTEHVCCGLLDVDSELAAVFGEHGAPIGGCIEALVEQIDADEDRPVYVPFTGGAKSVFADAEDGQPLEPRGLMLSLLSDDGSGASSLLYSIGADVASIREALAARHDPAPVEGSLSAAVARLEAEAAGIADERAMWEARIAELEQRVDSERARADRAETTAATATERAERATGFAQRSIELATGLCEAVGDHRERAGEHVSPLDVQLYGQMEEVARVLDAEPNAD